MAKLNHNQKLDALRALTGHAELRRRKDGSWYVRLRGVEIGGNGFLTTVTQGGRTAAAAVNECFEQHTALPDDRYVVIHAGYPEKRRQLRWNGFMWADVRSS